MSKRSKLMQLCNLHDYDRTSHCFSDSTHQTCCMLGPEARKYADESGNPIGTAANNAYKAGNKKQTKKNLKPWCTCIGSGVCSDYATKFNDGTHIKFVNKPGDNDTIYQNIHPECEEHVRSKLGYYFHFTPGIFGKHDKCNEERKNKIQSININNKLSQKKNINKNLKNNRKNTNNKKKKNRNIRNKK